MRIEGRVGPSSDRTPSAVAAEFPSGLCYRCRRSVRSLLAASRQTVAVAITATAIDIAVIVYWVVDLTSAAKSRRLNPDPS